MMTNSATCHLLLARCCSLTRTASTLTNNNTNHAPVIIVRNPFRFNSSFSRAKSALVEINHSQRNKMSTDHRGATHHSQQAQVVVPRTTTFQRSIIGMTTTITKRFLVTSSRFCSQSDGDGDGETTIENHKKSLAPKTKTLLCTRPRKHIASLELNNPRAKNAFSLETADELVRVLDELELDSSVRCVVLSGVGADFTSGVDIKSFMGAYAQLQELEDVAHKARMLRGLVERFQKPFKRMHSFGKPIICVQHGLCLGLGMELAACSDVRYCTRDTRMAIREVLIGIAADVGSLQLMPRLAANQSLLAELIYSGRYLTIDEAHRELGFVSRVHETKDAALAAALELATTIASRSPVAVQGSKRNLQFSREHTFHAGLDYNAIWNSAMMQGNDVVKAISAIMSKEGEDQVEYDDL